ncbi:hypothetical protein [uncultured Methylobacterium sp.]|jgi:hypothetical protein|uniref:hypothetical protein n=1 Tax=uncultured Methylobacterium sp. TaxID=157278 RepID=UPI00262C019E|nr:hypothetical protein [uncultured Methylobacterium sp.]
MPFRLAAVAALALLAVPAAARDRSPPPPLSGDVDATGSVTPADPVLIPERDGEAREARRRSRQHGRDRVIEGPARELAPD